MHQQLEFCRKQRLRYEETSDNFVYFHEFWALFLWLDRRRGLHWPLPRGLRRTKWLSIRWKMHALFRGNHLSPKSWKPVSVYPRLWGREPYNTIWTMETDSRKGVLQMSKFCYQQFILFKEHGFMMESAFIIAGHWRRWRTKRDIMNEILTCD